MQHMTKIAHAQHTHTSNAISAIIAFERVVACDVEASEDFVELTLTVVEIVSPTLPSLNLVGDARGATNKFTLGCLDIVRGIVGDVGFMVGVMVGA